MEVSATSPSLQKMSFIRGSQPLWKAFWILYVLGSLSFTAIFVVLIKSLSTSHLLLQASHILNLQKETALLTTATTVVVIYIMYFLLCSISVWRCAKNTMRNLWANLAKIIISINFAWISWKAFVAFDSLLTHFSHQ
ncbi:hypothetical protein [Pseudomonas paeninsulae]|uniref:hypothetical protein n=1 Tax=Pseudomonas paeninsulae TaxID=3110772 RepID=UPI002D7681AA|nr:hypothetical protein [Pseudomonas sp. IT1137]